MRRTALKRRSNLRSKTPLKKLSGFKRKTPEKGTVAPKKGTARIRRPVGKPKKSARSKKMELKRALCETYGLPILPCSRWGTTKGATRTDLLRGMLWHVFSKWIRERDKDKPCISCGHYHEAKQAGHYVPVGQSSVALWFLETNVHGECPDCNAFQSFHLVPMRKNLVKLYGEKAVEQLDAQQSRKDAVKWEEIVYADLIKKYL